MIQLAGDDVVNQVPVRPDERIERSRVLTEKHAYIAAPGAGRFVNEVPGTRCIRQFIVTSIEDAEIMVKAELTKRVDVARIPGENPASLAGTPRRRHASRTLGEGRA